MSETLSQGIAEQISALEQEIIARKAELYRLKKSMPRFEVPDYELWDRHGHRVKLSDLFVDKQELILVHNMGASCPYCTLWADGFIGIHHHLQNRAAFAVSTPDAWMAMERFASSRGWKFPIYSTEGSTLKHDLGFQLANGSYYPGVSTFSKDEKGRIFHVAKAFFGPGDDFCSLWYLFDLLPSEDPDWAPQFTY